MILSSSPFQKSRLILLRRSISSNVHCGRLPRQCRSRGPFYILPSLSYRMLLFSYLLPTSYPFSPVCRRHLVISLVRAVFHCSEVFCSRASLIAARDLLAFLLFWCVARVPFPPFPIFSALLSSILWPLLLQYLLPHYPWYLCGRGFCDRGPVYRGFLGCQGAICWFLHNPRGGTFVGIFGSL